MWQHWHNFLFFEDSVFVTCYFVIISKEVSCSELCNLGILEVIL